MSFLKFLMRTFCLFAGKEKKNKNTLFTEEEEQADQLQQALLNWNGIHSFSGRALLQYKYISLMHSRWRESDTT